MGNAMVSVEHGALCTPPNQLKPPIQQGSFDQKPIGKLKSVLYVISKFQASNLHIHYYYYYFNTFNGIYSYNGE
jgi:hypothetical protein